MNKIHHRDTRRRTAMAGQAEDAEKYCKKSLFSVLSVPLW